MENKILWLATFDDGFGPDWLVFSCINDFKEAVKNFYLTYSEQFNKQFPIDYHYHLNPITFVERYKVVLKLK